MDFEVVSLDHVQLAMPAGQESAAEAFYVGILGFERLPKPPVLAARGGCWFQRGPVQIHLGVENDFRAAKKAHPALRVRGFDAFCTWVSGQGVAPRPDGDLPGVRRCYVDDPFGNRIEIIEEAA
jgi:catechol 2,3-dioxygenase-like lactoylglutathione lyase family enzyme